MIKYFTIYGERCSGTNYLENLIKQNFDIEITWKHGNKHFFGQNLHFMNSDNTLFICIVRDIYKWINSFFRELHHHPLRYSNIDENNKINKFLNDEWFSINDMDNNYKGWNKELMIDRNIFTGQRYKNIFELRHIKNKFIIDILPKLVKNYILIRYEDLVLDFENTMNLIKSKGLKVKDNIEFPINIKKYKNEKYYFKDKLKNNIDKISNELVYSHIDLNIYYERKLNYL